MYNMTSVLEAGNLYLMVKNVNLMTDYVLAYGILLALAIVFFMASKKTEDDTTKILFADSVIILFVAGFFWVLEFIPWQALSLPIIFVFGSIIAFKSTN